MREKGAIRILHDLSKIDYIVFEAVVIRYILGTFKLFLVLLPIKSGNCSDILLAVFLDCESNACRAINSTAA